MTSQKLNYPGEEGPMVLLSITDVTEVRRSERRKDALLQEKVILLQELQHRVANSLQIIASVLLQSARTAQSDDSRASIKEAHHRVMSVAALQHQLAASPLEEVDLGLYLVSLCRSISASMIQDPSKLEIETNVARVFVKADVSLSLGLIVTELVINALKHAFPGDQGGKILVGYSAVRENWTLSVSDDGVGMHADPAKARAGVGSSIVTALAAQLGAVIVISGSSPGTVVSITREAKDTARPQSMLAVV
jgi:two-component system, sensor histidine kinase PdtaS